MEVGSKWLQLLHEMVPTANSFALLLNPTSPTLAEIQSRDLQEAARRLGLNIHVLQASTDRDLEAIFATLIQLQAGGLVISSDLFSLPAANNSRLWRLATRCPQFLDFASSPWQAG